MASSSLPRRRILLPLQLLLLIRGGVDAWIFAPPSPSSTPRASSSPLRASLPAEDVQGGSGFPSRRRVFLDTAAALAAAISLAAPPAALAAGDAAVVVEATIPQAKLLGGLASASSRDVIITGANSGVGLEGGKLLVAAGHRVVLACRTQAKADAAAKACLDYAAGAGAGARPGGTAVGMECDLADLASVRAFAKAVKGKPLDSLVLNAGLALNTKDTVPERTKDGFEMTIGVNHLGHFLLANLLVDDLKGQKGVVDPRLVITASPVHDPLSGGGAVGSKASLGDLSGLAAGASFAMVDGGAYDPDKVAVSKNRLLIGFLFLFLEAHFHRYVLSRS